VKQLFARRRLNTLRTCNRFAVHTSSVCSRTLKSHMPIVGTSSRTCNMQPGWGPGLRPCMRQQFGAGQPCTERARAWSMVHCLSPAASSSSSFTLPSRRCRTCSPCPRGASPKPTLDITLTTMQAHARTVRSSGGRPSPCPGTAWQSWLWLTPWGAGCDGSMATMLRAITLQPLEQRHAAQHPTSDSTLDACEMPGQHCHASYCRHPGALKHPA